MPPGADGPGVDHRVMLGLASRPSDSPYVERVWRSEALGGPMTSVAAPQREIVFWRDGGRVRAAVPLPALDSGIDTGSEHAEGFVDRLVLAATGLTRGELGRIERVRRAAILLGAGVAPLEVVGLLGYHDHPHLARALARYVGRTASRLRTPDSALSLPSEVDDPLSPRRAVTPRR